MNQARILVVEDEPILSKDISGHLRRWGHEVVGRERSGEAAVETACRTRPDLVLMDILLDGNMDGIDAAVEIRKRVGSAVVYLTAHSSGDLFDRAKASEPFGYLTKPVAIADLQHTVEMALFKHSMDRKLRESEERYRILAENALTGIAVMQDDVFVYANQRFADMFGISRDDVIGLPFWKYVVPEDRERVKHIAESRLAGANIPAMQEYAIRSEDGLIRWIQTWATRIDRSGRPALLVNCTDITDRKKAEIALEENRSLLQLIVDALPVGLIYVDKNLLNRFSNETYRSWWQLDEVLSTGRSVEDIVGSEVFERVRHHVEAALAGEKISYETRVPFRDGKTRDVQVKLIPHADQSGSVEGFVGLIDDTTERTQNERELLRNKERLELAVDAGNLGLWESDLETGVFECHPKALEMIGYRPEEIDCDFDTWKSLVHPDDWPSVSDAFNAHIEGYTPEFESEYRIRTKRGAWTWIYARGRIIERSETGEPKLMAGTNVDVGTLKAAQEALRESERKYRLLADNASDMIWTCDREGRFTYVSPAVETIRGFTVDEVLQQTWRDALAPGSYEKARSLFSQRLKDEEQGKASNYTLRTILEQTCKDGSTIWTETLTSPLYDDDGTVIGLLGHTRDISDRAGMHDLTRNEPVESEESS